MAFQPAAGMCFNLTRCSSEPDELDVAGGWGPLFSGHDSTPRIVEEICQPSRVQLHSKHASATAAGTRGGLTGATYDLIPKIRKILKMGNIRKIL